jgi:hypothetical protein
MRSHCIAILPSAGLGNVLFSWAHSEVFGALNRMPSCSIGWNRPHIGPLLRGERVRAYGNTFPQSKAALFATAVLRLKGTVIYNSTVTMVGPQYNSGYLFLWNQIPHWADYFANLRAHRDLVKKLIWAKITPAVRNHAMRLAPPVIAVHIRRGDFRNLAPHEDFARVGSVRTPLEYFTHVIMQVRRCCRFEAPVTVFTDGEPFEIQEVLDLPNVELASRNKPIVDMLLMSRAQLIVASASSTFSLWSGFLADSPIILHPDHIHAPLRPRSVNDRYYEGAAVGPCLNWPDLLIGNVRQLRLATY